MAEAMTHKDIRVITQTLQPWLKALLWSPRTERSEIANRSRPFGEDRPDGAESSHCEDEVMC